MPDTLYAGTNGGGLFKSFDGGANWAAANTGLTYPIIQALAIDPFSSSTLYAGTAGGVFKSTDGGAGWVLIGSGFRSDNILSLAITPQNPSIVYAGTVSGLYKTTDGGVIKGLIIELTYTEGTWPLASCRHVLSGHPVSFWIPRSSRGMTGFGSAMWLLL